MKTGAAISLLLHAFFFFLFLHTPPLREVTGQGGVLSLSLISSGQGEAKGEGCATAANMDTQEKEELQESFSVEETPAQETGGETKDGEIATVAFPMEHDSLPKRAENRAEKKEKPSQKAQHRSRIKTVPEKNAQVRKEDAGKGTALEKDPASGKGSSGKGGIPSSGREDTGEGGMANAAFGSENGPSFLRFVRPEYPLRARRRGLSGIVRLLVTLDEYGRAVHIEVMGDPPSMLAETAAESIRRSSFRPYRKEGKALSCRTVIPVRFVLE